MIDHDKSPSNWERYVGKKKPVVAGAKLFLASLGISCGTHQICVVRSGKVREKCPKKSGNSN